MSESNISAEQMHDAIVRSGYLLEQRLKAKIERYGYFVETNQHPDPETGISREYDISAMSGVQLTRNRMDFVFPYIICECENNAQPVVFFKTDSPISFLFHREVKFSGIPVQILRNGSWVPLGEFLGFEKFHHYCRGQFASQYCSFTNKSNRWIASHSDVHHQTFTGLANAVEASIEDHYAKTSLPRKDEIEPVNIQIYYPLVVLQGELYLANETRQGLKIKKVNHVQFRREVWSANRREAYQIDVIRESFIDKYLKLIDKEAETIRRKLNRKSGEVHRSADRLIAMARRARTKKGKLRRIYEPRFEI
jgi:hypothetical protein